jgi:cytochrome c peroxidase
MRTRSMKSKVWVRSAKSKLWTAFAIWALTVLMVTSPSAQNPGGITNNSGLIPFDQAFFAFEVETPLGTLKETPIWDELEQMLDNPYQFVLDPTVAGNPQGWPSYRMTQPRRRSFIFRDAAGAPCAPLSAGCTEVPLAGHLIHPLNYNHSTGEELRVLNIEFAGAPWSVGGPLVQTGDNSYEFTYLPVDVSPGADRVEADEMAIDFNSPIATDTLATIVSVDAFFLPGPSPDPITPGSVLVPEGALITGGDPGEPGYLGFGVVGGSGEQYSVPAVPGIASPETPIPTSARLVDPVRGTIEPRTGPSGGLRKPSLRTADAGGTPINPNYLANAWYVLEDDPSALLPSNENDYYRGSGRPAKEAARHAAEALGKALFWDMQVGSDTVQACGSCHFHAGADNRTKNQLNPNHLGGDLTLQLHGGVPNQDLTAADFPFHRGPQDSTAPGDDINDVASSMGVRFRKFVNIPTPGAGAFGPADAFGVRTLLPDIGDDPPGGQSLDPIPVFQGLRRVEPRNTPTLFGTAMNFDNFWDGRARHDFNGGSVFGPADPQNHVFVSGPGAFDLNATRQMIRFASIASLATGPALSEFEMSFLGRNWAKIGKKLLQGTGAGANLRGSVTPLANQLVSTTDSVLGLYSNQGGSACAGLAAVNRVVGSGPTAPNKPGLCISYPGLIRLAYYPALWNSAQAHVHGCFSSGTNIPQCGPAAAAPPYAEETPVTVAIPVLQNGAVVESTNDPFDGYVLTAHMDGPPDPTDTNEFSHMEANMSLFFGLSVHAWVTMLVPDDSPMDRFFDANPDSHTTFGESGEPGIANDLRNCFGENGTGGVQPCFTEVGNFKRDPGVVARLGLSTEGTVCDPAAGCVIVPSGGTRAGGSVDPLMGMDFFLGSNLSLKNPKFRSLRCGECHQGGTLTDHTFEVSHQVTFGDRIQEFITGQPGGELFPEALGRPRVISGFMLEGELQENAQDGIERNVADFALDFNGFPKGQALFDNGVYNIGVTPIGNDVGRGGNDAFGWPLSLSRLALKNLGGVDYTSGGDDPATGFAQPDSPGIPLPNFDPGIDPTGGGLFEPSAQDQQINPGFGEEPADPLLPSYLAKWASNIPVGDESNVDEVFVGLNTIMAEPMLEGFVDSWGPFNPAAIIGETFNNARQPEMATWPNVNRVNAHGAFKAPPLHNVEKTGPYFHNGGRLTLRQQLEFYLRGGDFPLSNSAHRDFLILNARIEDEALGGVDPVSGVAEFTEDQKEEIITSVIDFLLELTDERVAFQRAPFDQVEIFVPLDGTAPDNGSLGAVSTGRQGFLNNTANGMFRQVPATGAGGTATPIPNFLGIASGPRLVGAAANCGAAANNHYCK